MINWQSNSFTKSYNHCYMTISQLNKLHYGPKQMNKQIERKGRNIGANLELVYMDSMRFFFKKIIISFSSRFKEEKCYLSIQN